MRNLLAAAVAAAATVLAAGCNAQPAAPAQPAPNATAFLAQNALEEGVKTLPEGVQYKVVKSGPSLGRSPTPEDMVKVNYEGRLLTGEVFDSSYAKGQPATFRLGDLVPGWIAALQHMKPGDEWVIYVPPNLGYGARQAGPIPPNSVLIFRLELLAVGPDAGPAS